MFESKIINNFKKEGDEQKLVRILCDLLEEIPNQLQYISNTFTEYTPHNFEIHINNLLRIADGLVYTTVFSKLNFTEKFILIFSLIAHDWGMLINSDEKCAIILGEKSSNVKLLKDESDKWKNFKKERNITKEISDNDWQDYARITHAERSNIKVITFFERYPEQLKLGKLIGRVCNSHTWEKYRILQLSNCYNLNNDRINEQVLSVYLRLIDLLDISEDRTPHYLESFINPKNSYSKMEWMKHKSINPIDFDIKENIVTIFIHGETEDQNIYRNTLDLISFVEKQVQETNEILKYQNKYYWGHLTLDVNIKPEGFEPIDLKFKLHDENCYQFLISEIYDRDQYVFVRELIQNSIDAIEARKHVYKNTELTFRAKIIIEINDDMITISDNGIGMDLNVIKEYFTVIGKSYYRDSGFLLEFNSFRPIARFGIGFLSCFEVSDNIEVLTKSINQEDGYKLDITDKFKFIGVESVKDIEVGTKIRLKLKEDIFKNYKLIDYMRDILFDDTIPIAIRSSNGNEEISNENILNEPYSSKNNLINTVHENCCNDVHMLYDLNELIIDKEYNNIKIKGQFSYFTLKTKLLFFQYGDIYFNDNDFFYFNNDLKKIQRVSTYYDNNEIVKKPASANYSLYSKVHYNNILIPQTDIKIRTGRYIPSGCLNINIDDYGNNISISRNKFFNLKNIVYSVIYDELKEKVLLKDLKRIKNIKSSDQLLEILFIAAFKFPLENLINELNFQSIPLVLFDSEGYAIVRDISNVPEYVEVSPTSFTSKLYKGMTIQCLINGGRLEGIKKIKDLEIDMILGDFIFEKEEFIHVEAYLFNEYQKKIIEKYFYLYSLRYDLEYKATIFKLKKGKCNYTNSLKKNNRYFDTSYYYFLIIDNEFAEGIIHLKYQQGRQSIQKIYLNKNASVCNKFYKALEFFCSHGEKLDKKTLLNISNIYNNTIYIGSTPSEMIKPKIVQNLNYLLKIYDSVHQECEHIKFNIENIILG